MVEIHCTDASGEVFIMNHFSSDNTELDGSKEDPRRIRLINRATHLCGEWSKVYPHDKFRVVEV